MKSVIKEGNTSEKEFPKLMVNPIIEIIVLFSEEQVGVVVYSDNPLYHIGYSLDAWEMTYFKDFNGTIELSNN